MNETAKSESVEILLTAKEIRARVKEIAYDITRDFEGRHITLLGTLKGAVFFLTDLARELPFDIEIDFIRASSYGNQTESSGTVAIDHAPAVKIEGKNIIVIEDIVDTGHTAVRLREYLLKQNAAEVRLCSLLDKPERRVEQGLKIDYLGFEIPDKFVVGYGLDYAQRYRNLPYVGILNFHEGR